MTRRRWMGLGLALLLGLAVAWGIGALGRRY